MLSAMSQNKHKHHQHKHLKTREAPTPKPASEVILFQPPGGSRDNHTDRLLRFSSYWELVSKLLSRTEKNIQIHLVISMICFSGGGSYHFLRKMKKKEKIQRLTALLELVASSSKTLHTLSNLRLKKDF